MSYTVNLQLKILKSDPGKNLVAFAGRSGDGHGDGDGNGDSDGDGRGDLDFCRHGHRSIYDIAHSGAIAIAQLRCKFYTVDLQQTGNY